ncbi:MAG: nucleotidyltransferase domain-containing protein [Candidatus Beckwithbacteria bacterium]|nr:nucleotidyltransferase domain-containing protein [Candidatus Beckwithbacteria bacterium]
MSTINISLPDKLKADADRQIEAGYYVSFSDLVRTALRQLLPGNKLLQKAVINKEKLADFCRKNGIKSLKLFGSLARGEARPDSDADLLVEFDKDKIPGLFGLLEMESELTQEFRRPVELITKLNKHVKPYAKKDMINLYG